MSLQFEPHPRIRARIDRIGAEQAAVLVIDDFANQPEALVEAADAAFAVGSKPRSYFPGRVTPVPESFAFTALRFLMPSIRKAFGFNGVVKDGGCDFQILTSPPEQLSERQRVPHIDSPDPNILASVYYLCEPRYLGTRFYRHKSTGYERIGADRLNSYEGKLSRELLRCHPEGYITEDTPLYSKIANYDATFNRMILFRGCCLHSAAAVTAHGFDESPTKGRLTANMFLHFAA